jgi:ubiquinone/menaquinone biosynthesis C-methylase UbiE
MALNSVDTFIRHYLQIYSRGAGRVLDIGCGPAPYRSWISGQYIGLDISDEAYAPGMPRNVDVVASAMDLPLRDNSFDLVFSKSAFFLIPDPSRSLREIYRVLKPGCRVLLFDYNRRTQRRLQQRGRTAYPCWTQWQLRKLVYGAGFQDSEILIAKDRLVSGIEYRIRLLLQELIGTWAIVTGVK